MRSKIYISETHGLGLLIEQVRVKEDWGYDAPEGHSLEDLHTWFAKPDGDPDWIFFPVFNGQVFDDPEADNADDRHWVGIADNFNDCIEDALQLPDPASLTARQLECEHYEFGAGVLLRGCLGVPETDTLFVINTGLARHGHRLDQTTLRRHSEEFTRWTTFPWEYFDGEIPVTPVVPEAPPAVETPVAATPTNPLVQDALTPEPRRDLPTPDPGPGFRLRHAAEVVPVGTAIWTGTEWREDYVREEIEPRVNTEFHYRIPVPSTPTARVVIRQGAGLCVLVEGVRYTDELRPDYVRGALSSWIGRTHPAGMQWWPYENGNPVLEPDDAPFPEADPWTTVLHERVESMPPMPDLNAPVLLAEHWELGVGYLLRGDGDGVGPTGVMFIGQGRHREYRNYIAGYMLEPGTFALRRGSGTYEEHLAWRTQEQLRGHSNLCADLVWPLPTQAAPPTPSLQRALGNTLHMLYRTQSPLFRGSFRARFNRVVPDLVGDELEAWLIANAVRVMPTPAPCVPAPIRAGEPELEIVCRFTQERRVVQYDNERGSASAEVTISRSDIEELLEEHGWDLDAVADALEERAREEVNDNPPEVDDYDHINTDYGDSQYGDTEVTVRTRIRPALEQFIREHNIEQPAEI